VRLYQLKDVSKLQAASLEQLLDNDRAVLGDDLVSVKEITLYPDEGATPAIDRRERGPGFFAVVAFFRHPAGAQCGVASKLAPRSPASPSLSNSSTIRRAPETRSSVTSG